MRTKARRGAAKPFEFVTSLGPCQCGDGNDRLVNGSWNEDDMVVTCAICHQVLTQNKVTLSRRQMRDMERHFSQPHVCPK